MRKKGGGWVGPKLKQAKQKQYKVLRSQAREREQTETASKIAKTSQSEAAMSA